MNLQQLMIAPTVGAGIGYFTNYLAIKMLFKPYYPIKVMGVTVIRQGIIPAKRGSFARSIGNMVGNHLLTSEQIVKSLDNPVFHDKMHDAISSLVDELLNYNIQSIQSLVPEELLPQWQHLVATMQKELAETIRNMLSHPDFASKVESFMEDTTNRLLSMEIGELLSDEVIENIIGFLDIRLDEIFSSEDLSLRISSVISTYIDEVISSDRTILSLIPEDLHHLIFKKLNVEIIENSHKLAKYLNDEEFIESAYQKVKASLSEFMVKKSFFSRTIAEFTNQSDYFEDKLKKIITVAAEELAEFIVTEDIQERMVTSFDERIAKLLDTRLEEVFTNVSHQNIIKFRDYCTEKSLDALREEGTRKILLDKVRDYLVKTKHTTFGDVLATKEDTRQKQAKKIHKYLTDKVLEITQGPMFDVLFINMIGGQVDYLLTEKHIGRLADVLPEGNKEKVNKYVLDKIMSLLKAELPRMIDSINIRQIVQDKVDSLDLPSLEKLLFDLLEDQFSYINFMGGVLGGIIGLINLILFTN